MIKIFAISFLFPPLLYASQQSLYGLGAQTQAMGNSTYALAVDAYSQNYNPALMQFQKGQLLSFGVQGAFTNFNTINQVQTCTPALFGACPTSTSDVNTKTPDTFLTVIGFKTPLGDKERAPNLGLFLVLPLQQALGINMQNSFLPQYTMYLSDTQTFSAGFNLSFNLGEQWALGVGGQIYLTQMGTAQLELPTGGNATGQLKLDARPGIAPTVGLIKKFEDLGYMIGLSYLGKQNGQFVLNQSSAIGLLPGGTGAPLSFSINSSVLFNPETYVLGASYQNDIQSISFSANYERWSQYVSSQMVLNFQTFQNSFSQNLPVLTFRDIWTLHAGFQRKWAQTALRLGYAFVPTPAPDLSGDINFVDADKHELGLGFGILNFEKILGLKSQLDFAVLMHYLIARQITKTSTSSLGYPGYKVGGTVWSYGITLSTEL